MWEVEYTRKFLKELSDLPIKVQSRVEAIVFEELKSENPFNFGYIEKLKGHTDKYKIRVSDYRIGIILTLQASASHTSEWLIVVKYTEFFHKSEHRSPPAKFNLNP